MAQSERFSISDMGCVIAHPAPCPSSSGPASTAAVASRTAASAASAASASNSRTTMTAACIKQQQPMLQPRRRSSPTSTSAAGGAAAVPAPIFSVTSRVSLSRRAPRESNLTKSISKLGRGDLAPRRRSATEVASSGGAPSSSRSSNRGSTSNPAAAQGKREKRPSTVHAFSFPQFCPSCERQLTLPDFTVLYCSEHCRHLDSIRPIIHSMSGMPLPPRPPSEPTNIPTIVEPMMPSVPSFGPGAVNSIAISADGSKGGSDPTGKAAKPTSAALTACTSEPRDTPAARYLALFQRAVPDTATVYKAAPAAVGQSVLPPASPPISISSAGSEIVRSATNDNSASPSPSSTSSHPATASTSMTSITTHQSSLPTTPADEPSTATGYLVPKAIPHNMLALRPLPPRSNPSFSTTASETRDIGLVIPCAPSIVDRLEEQVESKE